MKKQFFEYRDGNTVLEAYMAFGPSETPKPAVLVFHAWGGRDEEACQKAEALAELGYVGIAMDVFGKGILGHSKEENSKLIQPFVEDRNVLKKRLLAGWEAVQGLSCVDSKRIAAIGFCFGGLCAIDLARSGVNVRGVVSFHGLLGAPSKVRSEKIQSKILVLHGHDDPMAPPEQVLELENEMTQAKVDWQVHVYGNTLHAFTTPLANDPSFGTVYQQAADFRSWTAMKNFLAEVLE